VSCLQRVILKHNIRTWRCRLQPLSCHVYSAASGSQRITFEMWLICWVTSKNGVRAVDFNPCKQLTPNRCSLHPCLLFLPPCTETLTCLLKLWQIEPPSTQFAAVMYTKTCGPLSTLISLYAWCMVVSILSKSEP